MKLRKWHHFISRCHKRKWLIYSYHFPCNSKWPHIKKWCQYTRLWHDWSYYVICDQVALTSLVIVSSMFLARFKSKNFPVYIEVLAPHLLLYCFNNVFASIQRCSCSSSSEADDPQTTISLDLPTKMFWCHPSHQSLSSFWSPTFCDLSFKENCSEWSLSRAQNNVNPRFNVFSLEDKLVSQVDTTLDSDKPLSKVAVQLLKRNAPGTKRFVWQ